MRKKNEASIETSINDLSNSRGRDDLELRGTRPENRDVVEITMPDGSKFLRRERTVLGKTDRLYLPEKKGFKRHWFNAIEPSRIQYAVDCNFVPATDESGNLIQPIDGDVDSKGVRQKMYPMEIPIEKWKKLQENTKRERENSSIAKEIENEMNKGLDNLGSKTQIFEDKLTILQK